MNIVIITTAGRPDLLAQSLDSLNRNSASMDDHQVTLVLDGATNVPGFERVPEYIIHNTARQGASAARNIGASSIPKYRRHDHVMFIDDDVYMLPGWDSLLMSTMREFRRAVISGHAHPYNISTGLYESKGVRVHAAGVLSTVHMVMPWNIWDDVGCFVEPGGPGGSEDVEWCRRASARNIGLAVTAPMCVVHCGLTSSSGSRIVGYDLMMDMNRKLIQEYELSEEEVRFG